MINYKEIIRLFSKDWSQRDIAVSCCCSKSTVQRTIARFRKSGYSVSQILNMTTEEVSNIFLRADDFKSVQYEMPDYAHVVSELSKPGVTKQLCWLEYCDECQSAGLHAYRYTQFAKYLNEYLQKTKATMHLEHKRGDIMEVDWAGTTLAIKNKLSGKEEKVYLFVAVLPYSGYTYAEAFLNMKQESWIIAHINAYNYFGGVTRILVPDNLKTGIVKNTRTETVINPVYQEMAEHYGTAIIPARPLSPKDKAAVEGTVGNLTNNLIAPLRNKQYFSLVDINEDIFRLLELFNNKPFQKKEGSRASLFEGERSFLIPLPQYPYELSTTKVAKVQYNYHISVDGKYYSCPYEYIGKTVNVRVTPNIIEIFYKGERIASHRRLEDTEGRYSTIFEHMPIEHQQYSQWNGKRFRKWARSIGESTFNVVSYFLRSPKVEEQGFKSCMTLLNLTKKYSEEEIEDACAKCLHVTRHPSLKSIIMILETPKQPEQKTISSYGIVRGPEYYARKGDD